MVISIGFWDEIDDSVSYDVALTMRFLKRSIFRVSYLRRFYVRFFLFFRYVFFLRLRIGGGVVVEKVEDFVVLF